MTLREAVYWHTQILMTPMDVDDTTRKEFVSNVLHGASQTFEGVRFGLLAQCAGLIWVVPLCHDSEEQP